MGPQDIIEEINRQFDNAIIATDVGQHQMFTTQYIEITNDKSSLSSGGLGTMGYGFPAAIGAAWEIRMPVISISGDGGMQMNIQEFATAVLGRTPDHPVVFSIMNTLVWYASGRNFLWKALFDDLSSAGAAYRENAMEVKCRNIHRIS